MSLLFARENVYYKGYRGNRLDCVNPGTQDERYAYLYRWETKSASPSSHGIEFLHMAAASTIDFAGLLQGLPPGAWVAISERSHRVIAYAAELRDVLENARQQGESDPLIVRVPEQAAILFL